MTIHDNLEAGVTGTVEHNSDLRCATETSIEEPSAEEQIFDSVIEAKDLEKDLDYAESASNTIDTIVDVHDVVSDSLVKQDGLTSKSADMVTTVLESLWDNIGYEYKSAPVALEAYDNHRHKLRVTCIALEEAKNSIWQGIKRLKDYIWGILVRLGKWVKETLTGKKIKKSDQRLMSEVDKLNALTGQAKESVHSLKDAVDTLNRDISKMNDEVKNFYTTESTIQIPRKNAWYLGFNNERVTAETATDFIEYWCEAADRVDTFHKNMVDFCTTWAKRINDGTEYPLYKNKGCVSNLASIFKDHYKLKDEKTATNVAISALKGENIRSEILGIEYKGSQLEEVDATPLDFNTGVDILILVSGKLEDSIKRMQSSPDRLQNLKKDIEDIIKDYENEKEPSREQIAQYNAVKKLLLSVTKVIVTNSTTVANLCIHIKDSVAVYHRASRNTEGDETEIVFVDDDNTVDED